MKLLRLYFKTNLLLRILIGLGAGAVAGLIFGPSIHCVAPLGDIFVRLLKLIVMPVVLFTLIVGAASIHPARLGRVGVKALLLYTLTTAFAVAIGLLVGNVFKPGQGLTLAGTAGAGGLETETPSLLQTVLEIVPLNPFKAITDGNMLQTIFFAILFGMGIAFLRESQDERVRNAANTVFSFFDGCAEVMYKVVNWILEYAPIGVFALIAVVFGEQGLEAFGPLGMVTLSVYVALMLHLVIAYSGLLILFHVHPLKFLIRAREAMVTAFVTRSSGGTLPVSMDVAETRMGISKGVYSFTLPLGATINMDGTAIYQGVCVLFIGFAVGAPLTFSQQMTVILTAVLASIGTAGVPGSGAIMLMMVLNSVGMAVEPGTAVAMAYSMIFGIDALLDMGRTALNVTGDLVVTCAVAKAEGEIDAACWEDAPRTDDRAAAKV
ncbi:MAG: dicarboxylate/amino acid:cation symporter [Desulfatitalea sp.]|nr:dicarboxylate/amino acid:cation symporter [Desulfatitalea sp.]